MAAAAAAGAGEMPTEEEGSAPQRSAGDRLLLASCRAIKKQTGWQHRTLRTACDWATGELEINQHPGLGLSRYYRVVELGMESNSEELVEEALGQLHKLIAGGLVRRNTMTTLKDGSSANLAEILMDVVLLTGSKDKTVRRGGRAQAVKCLLSCVTSPEIKVHGAQLRRVYSFVRETFLIIDSTANRARHNKAQARATLDHILQVIFSRLEMEDSPLPSLDGYPTTKETGKLALSGVDRHPSPQARAIEALLSPQQTAPEATSASLTSSPLSSKAAAADASTIESLDKASTGFQGDAGEAAPSSASGVESEGVSTEMEMGDTVEGEEEEEFVSSNEGLDDVALGGEEAGDGERRVAEERKDGEGEEGQETGDGDDGAGNKLTVAQSDALMLLSDLCKWSLADERSSSADGGVVQSGGGVVETEAKLLESKTAALELIVAVLRNYGGARFRALPAAALLVREELCPALLHHCTSGVTEMVSLSLRVFVALVKGFKNHLKAEVEVFITSIFLRILESEHSAFDHKMLVLEAISGLCRDPVALVEMFVNYDCDLEAIDLFKRIVTALTKVAKGRSIAAAESAGKKELEEERSLQLMGMAGTVDVVASMVKAADLEELEGEMAMAPRREDARGREYKNSVASERAVSLSISPGRGSSCTTPVAAANSSQSRLSPRTPRANSEVATSTSHDRTTAASSLPTDDESSGATFSGTSSTIPGDRSGGGDVEARSRASALSSTWSGVQGPNAGSVSAAAEGFKRSRRGVSVGGWGAGEDATKGKPESARGRRGSFRFDGQGEAMLQAFDTKRRVQREVEVGIVKFNQKPKEGLAYLNSKGHLDSGDPASVASFLREQAQRLDKTEVGEFLGRGADYMGGFCVRVLHAYVDGMDFTDMLFDEAIRHFLSGFRLPGEAQKIDRMMEKFAERFCLQNGSVFPNPDTAFILAFSIIMLNTDLHNPSIPDAKRMTKEGFIKNNSGIDQGKSLPDDFLGGLYDRIASTPISLKEDDQLRRAAEGMSSGTSSLQEFLPFSRVSSATSKRRAAHHREREEMLKSSRRLLTRQRGPSSNTNRYTHLSVAGGDDVLVSPDIVDHVRLMYDITWGPVLAVFSEVLESSDDSELIEQCLEGFKKAVRIAGGLDITIARETLINALVRFTLLESSRHMKDKNVRCVKVLLCLALTDGNLLRESWGLVLRCISQLSRLQLFASGLQQNESPPGGSIVAETPPRKIIETTTVRKNAGNSIGVGGNNGSGGSGSKIPKAPRPTPQTPDVAAGEVTAAGEDGGTKAGKDIDAVAITVDEAGSREKVEGVDEKEHPTEESMTATMTTTTTTTTVSSSADWLSDLKVAFGVTGGSSTPKSSSGRDGGGGAMEQVMSYVKERDALLNDRRRKEREKAMGELATFFMGPSREEKARMVEEGNATAVMGQIDQEVIDRVFSATRLLNREAMQHFVEQLIRVSRSEIPQLSGRRANALGSYQGGSSGGAGVGGGSGGGASAVSAGKPRVFSMQKLVEIAHLNMDVRSRIEWAKLWGALADHLGTVGSMSGSTSVAMYTVDCLRQLALKFLDKDELRDFNFQRIFLGPFATIFRDSREAEIRELVVSCLNNVVLTKGPLIRSGWKTVLSVLRAAARDPKEDVVQPASRMLARLSGEQFPLVQYDFVDLVHALLEMSTSSKFLDVSLECVGHLRSCARELGEGRVDVTRQRPLLEATMSNTGQLPREVVEAAMADLGRGREREAEFGGAGGRRNLGRLTLNLDYDDDGHINGDGDSLSPLPTYREKQKQFSAVASGGSFAATVGVSSPSKASDSSVPVSGVGSAGRTRSALRLWWPLLAGLAEGVGDQRLDCRAAALSTLQDVLREYGSAQEFSVRVWPFILTRILLPASRYAGRTFPPPSSPPPLRPSLTPSPSTPQSRARQAAAVPSASPRSAETGAGAGAVSRSYHSHSSSAAVATSTKAFLCPASRGALPLDVGSWVHTTAPQLFRAAVIIVARNAKAAVPLGLPALIAFLEPHVCCSYRRRNGRGNGSRRRGLSWPPDDANREEVEEEEAGRENALVKKKKSRRESQPERREAAAAAAAAAAVVEARWSEELEAAAAAGALAAEEAGGTGSGLMSRIALESLGLLVEGLVDHEVPQEVLSFVCDSLLRTLRRCLPDSIGGAGISVIYGANPAHAVPLPRSKSDGETRGADSGADRHLVGHDAYAARPQGNAVGGLEMDAMDEADGNGAGVGGIDGERGIGSGSRNADDAWAVSRGKESGRDEDGAGIDGKRVGALLSGALRLERVLYGLARLHLLALGEDRARVLLGGLSEGVRYARVFHGHHSQRMSLFSANILVSRSGSGACELPHLLEQESEGLCYIFAVAFRLLGVRWPLSSTAITTVIANAGSGNSVTSDDGGVFDDSGQPSATIESTSFSLWPNRRAFEPPLPSSLRQHHQHQQGPRLRPPRPGQDSGGRDTGVSARVASRGVPSAPATPMLVVDDLLDWSGEGDTGPSGGGGDAIAEDAGLKRAPLWDGTALAREFLCNEGGALLKRYFEADGGVQRGRLEDGVWNSDDEVPLSPLSAPSLASSRPSSEAAPSLPSAGFGPESSAPVNPPPGADTGRSRHEKSVRNATPPQAPRVTAGAIRLEALDLVASRESEVRHLTPAVLLLLRGLLLMDSSKEFARNVSWVYPCLADLVVVRNLEVRAAVRELLIRVAPLLCLSAGR